MTVHANARGAHTCGFNAIHLTQLERLRSDSPPKTWRVVEGSRKGTVRIACLWRVGCRHTNRTAQHGSTPAETICRKCGTLGLKTPVRNVHIDEAWRRKRLGTHYGECSIIKLVQGLGMGFIAPPVNNCGVLAGSGEPLWLEVSGVEHCALGPIQSHWGQSPF